MELFQTPTSPYVRKVLVTAHELGLADALTLTYLRPSPAAPDATLSAHNPLSKIPTLILDDGTALYDSPVICDYLDARAGHRLTPQSGAERWRVLRVQALADGMLDAGILLFYESSQRPAALQWPTFLESQATRVRQGLDVLEREVAAFPEAVDLGQIAVACTLGWLAFRNPIPDLREGRPRLFAWYDAFALRPSMLATVPRV
jgi:glutathione S-transferase